MNAEEKLKQNWTNGANNYSNIVKEELSGPLRKAWTDIILENAPKKTGMDILDIGTGPGFFAIIMEQAGNNVTAVDCTEAMIEQARKNASDEGVSPMFMVSDGQKLNFSDESFDMIISRNVAWTLIDAESAYMEWRRLLKPNGRVIIFDANWNYRYFNSEQMKKYIEDMKNYEHIFNKPAPTFTKEEEDYRKSMPMCARKRPQWDLKTLVNVGYKKIYCDLDISDRIWDEERQVLNKSTPMFMIVVGN